MPPAFDPCFGTVPEPVFRHGGALARVSARFGS